MVTNRYDVDGEAEPISPGDGWWAAVMSDELGNGARADRSGWTGSPSTGIWDARRANEPPSADWKTVQEFYESDQTLELKVVGHNRGGLLVAISTLRGFVPASHLITYPARAGEEERKNYLARWVDQTLVLKVIELDPARGRIVLSERAALAGPGRRRQLLNGLEPGSVLKGTITNLTHFGAFVDLGGVEGLIHVSEVSWGRVDHPEDVLSLGQEVTVYVLSVDRDHARVALSLRRLQPDPWATVQDRYTIGQVVEGTITNVVDFGAFACIEQGLEGLIHVSELAEGNFMHPRNVVHEGEVVSARILSIDGSHRRLGLSLRQAEGSDYQVTPIH